MKYLSIIFKENTSLMWEYSYLAIYYVIPKEFSPFESLFFIHRVFFPSVLLTISSFQTPAPLLSEPVLFAQSPATSQHWLSRETQSDLF